MVSIKSLLPLSSFTNLIIKPINILTPDLNNVYRYSKKKNKTSILFNHLKSGHLFNDTLKQYDSSLKIQSLFEKNPIVITEKIQIHSSNDFNILKNDYYLFVSNLETGEVIDETITSYFYSPKTRIIQVDLKDTQSKQIKKLLEHIKNELVD